MASWGACHRTGCLACRVRVQGFEGSLWEAVRTLTRALVCKSHSLKGLGFRGFGRKHTG